MMKYAGNIEKYVENMRTSYPTLNSKNSEAPLPSLCELQVVNRGVGLEII
mgnify:CR=1 FL=1